MNTRRASSERSKDFWQSALGDRVLQAQYSILMNQVRRLHGNSVLWVGETPDSAQLLQQCMVRDTVYLSTALPDSALGAPSSLAMPSLNGQLEGLPFAKNQFNGLVLHHALECSVDPRAGLREAARVIAPGGRIVIVGFNPFSLFGLRSGYAKWNSDCLSGRRLVNPLRLFDWLELLGFILDAKPIYLDYRVPFVPPEGLQRASAWFQSRSHRWAWMQWIKRFPVGGVLIVSATKRTLPLTLSRLTRHSRRDLAPAGYSKVIDFRLAAKDKH